MDSKKRPFCLQIVGGAFSRTDIEDMDNSQTGDVFSDGGGFNCRDSWSPITQDTFDELKASDGEGAPAVKKEIEKQTPKPEGGPPDAK